MSRPKKHRRHGPKSTRAGCLLCKPHKRQGRNDRRRQERRADDSARSQLREAWSNTRNGFPIVSGEYA